MENPLIDPPPRERNALTPQTTRWLILGMLFLVTGFLGLPALWISRSFTTKEKIFWSIVNTIYTSALIAITGLICWWAFRQFFEP
jgi:hypothetical protein